jgi:hypothetical protein
VGFLGKNGEGVRFFDGNFNLREISKGERE